MSAMTINLALHRDDAKDAAICVSEGNGKGGKVREIWLPRAKIKYRALPGKFEVVELGGRSLKLQIIAVEIPEWLAEKEGLA